MSAEPTEQEASWHHRCTCGIAEGWLLMVEHDPDCPFQQMYAERIAEARREGASAALSAAADAWSHGEWADAPRCRDRIQERIANGQHVGDWLRARVALTEPTP